MTDMSLPRDTNQELITGGADVRISNTVHSFIDNRFTEFERQLNEMMDAKLDEQIDIKLNNAFHIRWEKRMIRLEERVAKIERDRQYEETRDIGISEDRKTQEIYRILNALTVGIKELNMKHFYGPTKKIGEITEFDGLLLIDKSRLHTFASNPIIDPARNRGVTDVTARLVIIEVKTTLNREKVDNKLTQMLQMRDVIRDIQAGSIDLIHATDQFKQMIQEHQVQSFPTEIVMIFAPEIADYDTIDYIKSIGDGVFNNDNTHSPMSESKYLEYCVRFLNRYIVTSYILNDKDVPINIKNAISQMIQTRAPTSITVSTFLTMINDSTINKKYKHNIITIFKPYNEMLPVFTYACGRVGLYENKQLYSPFGILALSDINHRGGVRRKLLTRKK